jgi:hypothetical protein
LLATIAIPAAAQNAADIGRESIAWLKSLR